jgi:hypothetical protein
MQESGVGAVSYALRDPRAMMIYKIRDTGYEDGMSQIG